MQSPDFSWRKFILKLIKRNVFSFFGIDEEGNFEKVTFAEMFEEVKLYTAAFRKHGLQKGDKVACYMSNRKEAIFAMLATTSIGAIWGGPQPFLGAQAASNTVARLGAKFLISVDSFMDYGEEHRIMDNLPFIADNGSTLEKIIIVPTKEDILSKDISYIPNSCFLGSFLESGKTPNGEIPDIIFEQLPSDHPVSVAFTSGTTGMPKGAVHSAGFHKKLDVDSRVFLQNAVARVQSMTQDSQLARSIKAKLATWIVEREKTLGWSGASRLSSTSTNLTRGLEARRLFRVPPCRKGTIHLQTSVSSPGFEPSSYGTTSLLGPLMDFTLHWNLKSGDVLHNIYPNGWTLWNFHVTCLSLGIKLLLQNGSVYRLKDGSNLWDVLSKYKVAHSYLVTSIVDRLEMMKAYPDPSNTNFEHMKAITIGASPVKIGNFKYIQSIVKDNVLISNLYGKCLSLETCSGVVVNYKDQESKLPVQLINTTSEMRLVQGHGGHEATPLKLKVDIKDTSSELDNGS
ncbi:acetoacetyl-CoA synthetase [Trichonephila clavipes]|nr:acetoacetyl-CoA synthetase [Trichonephila clavipes]